MQLENDLDYIKRALQRGHDDANEDRDNEKHLKGISHRYIVYNHGLKCIEDIKAGLQQARSMHEDFNNPEVAAHDSKYLMQFAFALSKAYEASKYLEHHQYIRARSSRWST